MGKLVWELVSSAKTSELLAFEGTKAGQWPNTVTVLHPLFCRPQANAAWVDAPTQPGDEQRVTLKNIGPLPSHRGREGRIYAFVSESDVDIEFHVYEDRG